MKNKEKLPHFSALFKSTALIGGLAALLVSADALANQNRGVAGGSFGSDIPSLANEQQRSSGLGSFFQSQSNRAPSGRDYNNQTEQMNAGPAAQPVVIVDGNTRNQAGVPVTERNFDANVETEVVKVPVPIYQPVYQNPSAPQQFMNQGYQPPMGQPQAFGQGSSSGFGTAAPMPTGQLPNFAPQPNFPPSAQFSNQASIQIDHGQTSHLNKMTRYGADGRRMNQTGMPLPDIDYGDGGTYRAIMPQQNFQAGNSFQAPQNPVFQPSARTTSSMSEQPYDVRPAPGLMFEIDEIEELGEETLITRKIDTMREDLENLQEAISIAKEQLENIRFSAEVQAADYYAVVAAIQSRLQAGSTPGNPRLVNSWNIAQDRLDRLSEDVDALGDLSQRVAAQGNMVSYLLEAVRASFGLSGALEDDHARLEVLEDDVTSTTVAINRLLNEVTDDVNRRTAYLASERKNLQTLAAGISNGELFGASLTNQYMRRVTDPMTPEGMQRIQSEGYKPLAIIRFNKPNVNYQQPVFAALNDAIRINPDAQFEIIALSSNDGTSSEVALAATDAKQKAESVVRTLSNMGLPNGKMLVSNARSAEVDGSEVHIYVR